MSVEAVALVDGFVSAGSSLHIRFSHNTNMPPVLARSDLHEIVKLSPLTLHEARTVAAWQDNRTLVVLFPTLEASMKDGVTDNNVTVSFVESAGMACILTVAVDNTYECLYFMSPRTVWCKRVV